MMLTVKLAKSSSSDPQDTGLQPVVNPPCWAPKAAVSLNLTIPRPVRILSVGLVRARDDSCNNAAADVYEGRRVAILADPSRVLWKLGFWRNQLAEQLDHSTSSRDLLPCVSQERRELLVAVDLAELNLSEGDEPIQQRQRGRLGAEGGLGLGSATEFPIEIL